MKSSEYLAFTHAHVLETVKLADQKATALVAIDIAIFAGVFEITETLGWQSSVALGILGLAVLASGYVIWPRMSIHRKSEFADFGELAFPEKIAALTPAELLSRLSDAEADIDLELSALVTMMASIYREKYRLLRWAMGLSVLGACWSGFVAYLAVTT